MSSILKRLKNKFGFIKKEMARAKISGIRRAIVHADIFVTELILGAKYDDYFKYRFYNRSFKERKTFIYSRRYRKIYRVSNGPTRNRTFDSKILFNRKFSEFVKRDWLDMENCTLEEFQEFANKHEKAFVKPRQGSWGTGSGIFNLNENTDELYQRLRKEKALVEQLIVGDPDIESFNPESLNTLRVVTLLCADGTPKVITAGLRIGNGDKAADNFHLGGLATIVNVETGTIETDGVDHDMIWYEKHPVTGKKIKGFKINKWDEIVSVVKKAAMVMPEVRYVGWDIAIDKDGRVIIIEGNCCADPDVSQIPDQKGKWHLYEDEIKKLSKLTGRR